MLSLSALWLLTILVSAVPLRELEAKTHRGMVYHDPSYKAVSQEITFQPGGECRARHHGRWLQVLQDRLEVK